MSLEVEQLSPFTARGWTTAQHTDTPGSIEKRAARAIAGAPSIQCLYTMSVPARLTHIRHSPSPRRRYINTADLTTATAFSSTIQSIP